MTLINKLRQNFQLLPALKFVWHSSAVWTIARVVLVILQGLLPLVLLYLLKLFVDQIALALNSSAPDRSFNSIMLLLVVYGVVSLVNNGVTIAAELVNTAQSQRVTDYMQNMLLEKSIAADLEYYENPDYYDTLQRAQKEAPYRPSQLLNHLVKLGQSSILLVGVLGLLISLHWVLAIALFMGGLPVFVVRLRFAKVFYRWRRRRTAQERESTYLSEMLTTDTYAKEVRLFGLGRWLRERYGRLRWLIYRETLALVTRRSVQNFAVQLLSTTITIGVFGFIAYSTINGRLQIGDLVLYQQALQRGDTALSTLLRALSGLYEDNLFLKNLYEFLELQPRILEPTSPQPCPSPIQQE
ncbi:MAG: ABC transporter transmembrane domain-containing protein, partial [Cyanobacteria bacterium P01_F01_bin.3]